MITNESLLPGSSLSFLGGMSMIRPFDLHPDQMIYRFIDSRGAIPAATGPWWMEFEAFQQSNSLRCSCSDILPFLRYNIQPLRSDPSVVGLDPRFANPGSSTRGGTHGKQNSRFRKGVYPYIVSSIWGLGSQWWRCARAKLAGARNWSSGAIVLKPRGDIASL